VVSAAVAILVTIGYTPISTVRWSEAGTERGLDGSAYLARANPGDAATISWVDQHANVGDVLVEAPGCGYGTFEGVPMNRVSSFTGVPAVLGWRNHEGQWRRGEVDIGPLLDERQDAANAWLSGLASGEFEQPSPRFIIIGSQELNGSTTCELVEPRTAAVFDALAAAGWQVAFESGATRVYVPVGDPSLAGSTSED
jgi:hypothetical protein